MEKVTIAELEDAILSTLRAALPTVPAIDSYAGQLEDDIKTMTVKFPAVFVIYNGSQYEQLDNAEYNEEAEISVLVAAKNLRSKDAARRDAMGCYELAAAVLTTLNGSRVGLDIAPLQPLRMQLVLISQPVTVYGIDFRTNFDGNYTIG